METQLDEENNKKIAKVFDSLQILAIAVGLLTSCILVAGYTWYLGHISAFGLSSSLLNRGFGDVIAESWYVGLMTLVYLLPLWWYPLIFVAVVGILMLVGLYYVAKQRAKGNEPFRDPITRQNQGRKIFGLTKWLWICWFEAIQSMSLWAIVPGAIMVFAFMCIAMPYKEGNDEGKAQIRKYQEEGCAVNGVSQSPARCVALVEIASPSSPVVQGLLVNSTSERIAIFNESGLQVWPLTNAYRIERTYINTLPTSAIN